MAKAADGSARDATSLLDQAISLGLGNVKVDVVKNMIGLADRSQTFELFEALTSGKVDTVLSLLENSYKNGANPTLILQDLINVTHLVAKTRIIPNSIDDSSLSEEERNFAKKMSVAVSIAVLSKIWQMMIKGLNEMQMAPVQVDALEMILIRIAYAANLPTPAEILNDVKKNSNLAASAPRPLPSAAAGKSAGPPHRPPPCRSPCTLWRTRRPIPASHAPRWRESSPQTPHPGLPDPDSYRDPERSAADPPWFPLPFQSSRPRSRR